MDIGKQLTLDPFNAEQYFRIKPEFTIRSAQSSYNILKYLGAGGSGIVYRARVEGSDTHVAIKFYLPVFRLHEGRQNIAELSIQADEAQKEFNILRKIHHSNIVRILDSGVLDISGKLSQKVFVVNEVRALKSLPFLVTELLEDAAKISDALSDRAITFVDAVEMLLRLLDALVYLHDFENILHTDISKNNVLVNWKRRIVKLIDFGLSKYLPPNSAYENEFTHLRGDVHLFPELPNGHPLRQVRERGGPRSVLRQYAFPALDVFQFWKLLCDHCLEPLLEKATPTDTEYIQHLVDKYSSWESVQRQTAATTQSLIQRLLPSFRFPYGIPELSSSYSADRVVVLANAVMPLPDKIEKLINTRAFRRLSLMRQLTTLELVYPSASHTRYEHCLSTCELTRCFLESLVQSPIGRAILSESFVQRALIAALLHDINHFPLLHFFQELPGTVFEPPCDLFDLYCGGILSMDKPSIYGLAVPPFSSDRELHDLLTMSASQLASQYSAATDLPLIKSLIDSGVDVDKISYLLLDSMNTGVRYGHGLDITTLVRNATIAQVQGRYQLAFKEGALAALENVVLTRYWNFRQVYWHHTNRALVAIISEVLRHCYCKRPSGLKARYNLDDLLAETFGYTDREFLSALSDKAASAGMRRYPLKELFLDRKTAIFKRLYVIHPELAEDAELFALLKKAWESGSLYGEMREHFADKLSKKWPDILPIEEPQDIVFDLPGRKFDKPEEIYVLRSDGEPKLLRDISPPVRELTQRFEELTKRARIFVAPNRCQIKTKTEREHLRGGIRDLLLEVLRPQQTTVS